MLDKWIRFYATQKSETSVKLPEYIGWVILLSTILLVVSVGRYHYDISTPCEAITADQLLIKTSQRNIWKLNHEVTIKTAKYQVNKTIKGIRYTEEGNLILTLTQPLEETVSLRIVRERRSIMSLLLKKSHRS